MSHHNWESNGCCLKKVNNLILYNAFSPFQIQIAEQTDFDGLDSPKNGQTGNLEQRELVNDADGHMADVNGIRLVFHRHQHQQNAVEQLNAAQRGNAHVEEHTVEDGHRNMAEQFGHCDGQTFKKWMNRKTF